MKKIAAHPFAQALLTWYQTNARDLPWRQTQEAYVIWLSEIILQQTRVAQGLPYFHRLLTAFPTVFDLAAADESTLFRHWQGLGYYSRARNLHKTAKRVVEEYGGDFPSTYTELLGLAGVGPYTAAAIASFAFGEAQAVVDGNVYRILARYFGVETDIMHASARREFTDLANSLIPHADPARFNQAIMEFGSLQCSPVPLCETCPLVLSCVAHTQQRVASLPLKSKSKPSRVRYFNYVVVQKGEYVLVRQRAEKDIWQGLWEFVLVETPESAHVEDVLSAFPFLAPFDAIPLQSPAKHLLSHQTIYAKAWFVRVPDTFERAIPENYTWILSSEFENVGKPVLLLNLITDNLLLQELLHPF